MFYAFIMQFSLTQFPFLTNKKSPKECCWNYLIVNGYKSQGKIPKKSNFLGPGSWTSLAHPTLNHSTWQVEGLNHTQNLTKDYTMLRFIQLKLLIKRVCQSTIISLYKIWKIL